MEISELFRITAKAVILVNGKVILLRKHTRKWDLPGGRLDVGEEIEICLAREVLEETGLDVNVGPLIECNLRRLQDTKRNVIVLAYLCTFNGTCSDIMLSTEHTEVRLFSDHEIDSLDMLTAYHKPVRKVFNQQVIIPNAQNTVVKLELPHGGRSLLQILKERLFSS